MIATTLLQGLYNYVSTIGSKYEHDVRTKEKQWCVLFEHFQQCKLENNKAGVARINAEMYKLDIFHFLSMLLDSSNKKEDLEKLIVTKEHRMLYQICYDENFVLEQQNILNNPIFAFVVLLTAGARDAKLGVQVAEKALQMENCDKYLQSAAWYFKAENNIDMMQLALKKYERNKFALHKLVVLHLKKGEHSEAKVYFDRALAIDPESYNVKVVYYTGTGAYDQAEEAAFLEINQDLKLASFAMLDNVIRLAALVRKRTCEDVLQVIQSVQFVNDDKKNVIACFACILFNNVQLLKEKASTILLPFKKVIYPFITIMEQLPTLWEPQPLVQTLGILPSSISQELVGDFLHVITGYICRNQNFIDTTSWLPLAEALQKSEIEKFAMSNPKDATILIASIVSAAEHANEAFQTACKELARDPSGKALMHVIKKKNSQLFQ